MRGDGARKKKNSFSRGPFVVNSVPVHTLYRGLVKVCWAVRVSAGAFNGDQTSCDG